MNSDQSDAQRQRLRWRCRRGMQELDILLERWLERDWPAATAAQRRSFETLLATEDDLLWAWVTGREQAADPEIVSMVERLLEPST